MQDSLKFYPKWTLFKYLVDEAGRPLPEPYAVEHVDGNLALNEGIANIAALLIGTGGTAYDNANAYIGIGDDDTAEAEAQTGLQAATNKTWLPMDATYPQVSGQTIIWRATAGTGDANYAWKELTLVNDTDDTGDNFNRKVDSRGTKSNTMQWVIQLEIVLGS
jgi:hypothetical protein